MFLFTCSTCFCLPVVLLYPPQLLSFTDGNTMGESSVLTVWYVVPVAENAHLEPAIIHITRYSDVA